MDAFLFSFSLLIYSALATPSPQISKGKKPSPLSPRTVFVQMFEWKWNDIANECETYLGPNGFAAVQISPPQEHVVNHGEWWERYQPVSYQLHSRSGNESEFKNMITRCQKAGVDIYADVVLNHMAGFPRGTGFARSPFLHYDYPGLYSYDDFHHCGRNGNDHIINYQDQWEVQNCELLGLADLKTESVDVQNIQAHYLQNLLDWGVAGFRLDAAKHIPVNDLISVLRKVNGFPYIIVEAFSGGSEANEYLKLGDINVFAFPYDIAHAFREKDMLKFLTSFERYPQSEDAIIFIENHDLQRMPPSSGILSYQRDPLLYHLAQVFMLTWPYGYPQVFSGYQFNQYDQGPPPSAVCQGSWTCEHRLPGVSELVKFRNFTDSQFIANDIYVSRNGFIGFSRGNLGFVAINAGNSTVKTHLQTTLPDGQYCNILQKNCSHKWLVQAGQIQLELLPYTSIVLQGHHNEK